jgi:homoserine O-acetyltransferase/O-succinyltransferase
MTRTAHDILRAAIRGPLPFPSVAGWPEPVCEAQAREVETATTLALRHGGCHHARIRGTVVGPEGAPVAVVLGGISAHRHATSSDAHSEAGWWDAQVGPGRALDTRRLRIVCIDWLGADGGLDLAISTSDQAAALVALLDHLGVDRVELVVGASYGAMVALAFAAEHPDRVGEVVAISGGHRPHPYASAWRAVQRKILALGGAPETVSLARQLAMLSYRTPEEFLERFATEPFLIGGRARVAAEDYLDARGASFAAKWSATAFARLSESIDLHRIDPRHLRVPLTLVAVAGDRLAPPEDLEELAEETRGPVSVTVLESRYGHDAFLKEVEAISDILRPAAARAIGADCARAERRSEGA